MDYSSPGSSVHGILQARQSGLPFPSLGHLPVQTWQPTPVFLPGESLGQKIQIQISVSIYLDLSIYLSLSLYIYTGGLVTKTLVTPWSVTCEVCLSMEFSRQEYWSRLPFHSLEDLPHLRWNSGLLHCRWSPALQADSLPTEPSKILRWSQW